MTFFSCIVVFALCFASHRVAARKSNRLSVLSLISTSRNEPYDGGTVCRNAQRFVSDIVNGRGDILPDYHIEPDFQDEGPVGSKSALLAIQFARRFQEQESNSTSAQTTEDRLKPSPIMIGPTSADGCHSFAPIVQHLEMVAIASTCPYLTNNTLRKPNNFYRSRMSRDFNRFALITFIKYVGRWNKVALFTHASHQISISLAAAFHQTASAAGLNVISFDLSTGAMDSTINKVKTCGARIFVLQAIEEHAYLSFLCSTYKQGLTGSRYVFLVSSSLAIDLNLLPDAIPGMCTKLEVAEQIKNSFAIGTTNVALEDHGKVTLLNFGLEDFENRFAKFASYKGIPADYDDRHWCFDRMFQSLLALDRAEKILHLRNRTLLDYQKDQKFIAGLVNQSVAATDFVGLRVGRIKYSNRLEVEDEPLYVTSWTGKLLYRIKRKENTSPMDINAYYLELVNQITWQTPSNKPPLDSARFLIAVDKVTSQGYNTFLALAVICASAKVVVVLMNLFSTRLRRQRFQLARRIILLIGCLLLDGASVSFTSVVDQGGGWRSNIICMAQPLLPILGLSLINAILVSRIFLMKRNAMQSNRTRLRSVLRNRARITGIVAISMAIRPMRAVSPAKPRPALKHQSSSVSSTTSTKSTTNSNIHVPPSPKPDEWASMAAVGIFFLFNAIIVGSTLAFLDPPNVTRWLVDDYDVNYNEADDSYTSKYAEICYWKYQTPIYSVIGGIHMLLLLGGSFLASGLHNIDDDQTKEAKNYRYAIFSQSILFLAISCLFSIIHSPINQLLFSAACFLFLSASTYAIIAYRALLEQLRTNLSL